MIYLYEQAIVNDLRRILKDSRVSVVPYGELFRKLADKSENDKVRLPAVSLTRLPYRLSINSNRPESKSGQKVLVGSDYAHLMRIPIQCSWQLDVIGRYQKDVDDLVRELIFYYVNNPTLSITIPYGLNQSHKFSIFFEEDISDNSDVESHTRSGEYFRSTLTISSPDTSIWKVVKGISFKELSIEFNAVDDHDVVYESDTIK